MGAANWRVVVVEDLIAKRTGQEKPPGGRDPPMKRGDSGREGEVLLGERESPPERGVRVSGEGESS